MNENINNLMTEAGFKLNQTIQDSNEHSSNCSNEGGSKKYNSDEENKDSKNDSQIHYLKKRDRQVICPIDIQKATSSNSNSSFPSNREKKIKLMKN